MVREVMSWILESSHFHKSKRYPAMLEYVVHQTLDGNHDRLKERVIGADVFGRPPDYDVGNDAVVRSAAGEVRRRLAAYFSEHPDAPVRIDLPLGSYTAELHFRSGLPEDASSSASHASPGAEHGHGSSDATHPESKATWRKRWIARSPVSFAALLLLAVVGVVVWRYVNNQVRARQELWWTVLHNDTPALIVLGGGPDPAAPGSNTTPSPEHMSQLSEGDALATTQICNVFVKYGHECKVAPARSATLEDLRHKSAVLIGAFDNSWTHRLLAPYRFEFAFDGPASAPPPRARMIADRAHPENASAWRIGSEGPSPNFGNEFAIVGRFHSEITDGNVVVVAGLGPVETSGAGVFISSPESYGEILQLAPKDWKGFNFEAVLQISVFQGAPGHIKVVAAQFW